MKPSSTWIQYTEVEDAFACICATAGVAAALAKISPMPSYKPKQTKLPTANSASNFTKDSKAIALIKPGFG